MDVRHRDVALFRYSLIGEAADPALSKADRGRLVRGLAARDHTGPGGVRVRVARNTLDRWIRDWRAEFVPVLIRQRNHAADHDQGERARLFTNLLDNLDTTDMTVIA